MAPNYGPKIVTDQLVLCLDAANPKSYPGTGSTWTDISKNGNNGTISGATFNASNNGKFLFDDTDDVVVIPNSASLNPTTGLSIASWVIFDANSADFIFEKGNVNTQYSLFSHSSDIVFRTKHVGDVSYHSQILTKVAAGIVNGQWHHIVGSWDGSNKRIYVDGVLKGTVAKTGDLVTTTPGAAVGRFGGTSSGYYFGGSIANVSIYGKGLSSDEVKQNFDAYKGRFGL